MTLIALRVLISFNLKCEKRDVSIIYSGLVQNRIDADLHIHRYFQK